MSPNLNPESAARTPNHELQRPPASIVQNLAVPYPPTMNLAKP